ncbi:MAG: isochorismate synthase [Planctomycetota bacterium]|nr:isochorismate synthase [Planctomycetota bacterium]MCX8039745.1 isochorismate synthase [Planctomycetota bacterium]MDW8373229.1 isochorismate synthase [Planctomycetota bacterium]
MLVDPLAAWCEAAFPRTLLWDDAGALLAEGVAWEATANGPGRGMRLARALGRLEGARAEPPVVMGALAFEDAPPLPSPWGALAGARLWLPARLRVDRRDWQCEQRETALAVERAPSAPWPHPPARFRDLVEDAAQLVRDGVLRKVVVARAIDQRLPANHRDDVALARLKAAVGPGACVYAHDLPDGALFLGATPEILCSARDTHVETHALAGTCAATDDGAGDESRIASLMASTKERKEHGLVVEHLQAVLRARCRPFAVESCPHVRRVGGLLHLETRIAAELLVPDYLDAIAALHPTPATCGLPVALAASWIARHERFVRGLYCGALGWLAPRGCHAIVPLRGALLAPDRSLARLFAGCGIVESSDPALEWEETELKLRVMRQALRLAHG